MVELKYDQGKMVVVSVVRIINFNQKFKKTDDFLCYWTPDMNANPEELECGYAIKFTGSPSIYKVFIIQLAGLS